MKLTQTITEHLHSHLLFSTYDTKGRPLHKTFQGTYALETFLIDVNCCELALARILLLVFIKYPIHNLTTGKPYG